VSNPLRWLLAAAILSTGLANAAPAWADDEASEYKVVDRQGPRPDWASRGGTSFESKGKSLFVIEQIDQKNLTMAQQRGQLLAAANIRDSIITEIQTKAGWVASATSKKESTDEGNTQESKDESAERFERYARSAKLHLPGISVEGNYWERVRQQGKATTSFKVYTLVSIPTKFLHKAQTEAARAALGLADEPEEKQGLKAYLDSRMHDSEAAGGEHDE
jgi:hypothetical protein